MMEWKKQSCVCPDCGRKWNGVVPDGRVDGLECPSCHKMNGQVMLEVVEVWFDNGAKFYAEVGKGRLFNEVGQCARHYLETHPDQRKQGWPTFEMKEMTRAEYMAIPATQESAEFWKGVSDGK